MSGDVEAYVGASRGRRDGYAPIGDYAAIGDGRTVALVAKDGSIDWLCLPDLDSPGFLARLLDAERGGYFSLHPVGPFQATRRYLPGTNVLETTYHTATGAARVIDALTLPTSGLCPQRELVRSVEGVWGSVELCWALVPRFGFGARPTSVRRRSGAVVATQGADAGALCAWGTGTPVVSGTEATGQFELTSGRRGVLTLSCAHQEPLVLPRRQDVEVRLEATIAKWQEWSEGLPATGRWRPAVVRSALALKLLVHAPSGAIGAAATTSLPEVIGGGRNWDYRFCWVRDSAFILSALLRLGCSDEAESFFWWLLQASQLTHPKLHVLYRLDGGSGTPERALPLRGYRGSSPVRIGNGASSQVQLDVYGDLLHAAWVYSSAGKPIDADIGHRLAEMADLVCALWHEPDAGLWEVRSGPRHFTQSKMMCWVALDRALRLASSGRIPEAGARRWDAARADVAQFIESCCWSGTKSSYVRAVGGDDLDAGLLLGVIYGYGEPHGPRMRQTVAAIRRELGRGPLVYRYSGEDGLGGREGAFLACSFWLVEALALQGLEREASDLMAQLVNLGNDVGLFSEEVDPEGGELLGNFPQALTHLALVNAALTLEERGRR